jgi:integrase
MKKDFRAPETIKSTVRKIKHIAKTTDLNNPEAVLKYLQNKKGKNSYIDALAESYNRYVKYNNLKWTRPKIKRTSQPPYVPSTEEITILISDAGKKYNMILSIFKDTGMRPIEMARMKMKWYEPKTGIINVESAKYGNGRKLKLKETTKQKLNEFILCNNFSPNDHLFPSTKTMQRVLGHSRKRTAIKLKRPELQKICLYSFRHYFASKLYGQTKDYMLVKKKLGHRRIEQTITYIHQVTDGFTEEDFITATAETVKEARKLIEDGYTKVDEFDGIHIYKKRK